MANYPPYVAILYFYKACLVVGIAITLILLVLRLAAVWRSERAGVETRRDPVRDRLAVWLGALWLLDGLLQAQPLMVTRFISGILSPLVAGQPRVVIAIVELAARVWAVSPIWFNVGATYVQILIGACLLFTRRSATRRFALWVSIVWGILVWSAGEAFGSVFGSGGPLVGSPGSVLLYVLAATLLLLPDRWWARGAWRKVLPIGFALYFALMTFLAVWPSNGWWAPGGLSGLVSSMAGMSQPTLFAAVLSSWSASLHAHPALWNALIAASCSGLSIAWLIQPGSWRVLYATLLWTFLVWFLGQDFGVLGGMGTDPNTGAILLAFEFCWAKGLQTSSWGPAGAVASEGS